MKLLVCIILGYLLGCINPSYLISKIKNKDIRANGTGNLGATNTFINFGRGWGSIVLVIDMLKAFLAVILCKWLFPGLVIAGILGGAAVVIGHIFPFYVHFHGGKGIASLGGFVLAIDWKYFLILLLIGCILALIFNYGCLISFSGAIFFPLIYLYGTHSITAFLVLALCSAAIICKHMDNIEKIRAGKELPVRDFLRKHIMRGLYGDGA